MKTFVLAAAAAGTAMVAAQDPAQGWLGYAVGSYPGGTRITFMEAYWKVGATPRNSNSFYSPWFGMDPADNLNLLQPVNPWLGNEWVAYTEYFQWSPEHNQNSNQFNVKAGDVLHGTITYRADTNSYDVAQTDVTSGATVTMNIPIQKKNGSYKNFTVPYFVYEKVAPCNDYPPDGAVEFYGISVFYDGKNVTSNVKWTTSYVEDVCDNRATVIDPTHIKITWNTKAADPPASLIEASQSGRFGLRRPTPAKDVAPLQPGAPAAAALA